MTTQVEQGAECTVCGNTFVSGTGHPDLAICGDCWKPGNRKNALVQSGNWTTKVKENTAIRSGKSLDDAHNHLRAAKEAFVKAYGWKQDGDLWVNGTLRVPLDRAVTSVKAQMILDEKQPSASPAPVPTMSYVEDYERADHAITHRSDGPVTRFVAISRAIRLARSDGQRFNHDDHDPIANAIYDLLFPEGEDETLIDGNGS